MPHLGKPSAGTPDLRVGVVAECFPVYRAAVLAELLRNPDVKYYFLGGTEPILAGYRTYIPGRPENFIRLRTRKIGPIRWQQGLLREIAARRFDVLIITGDWAFISTWLGAIVARLLGLPVLFWTHGWARPERGLRLLVRRCFYRCATSLLLYSEYGRRLAESYGIPANRLFVVHNSLDLPAQDAAAQAIEPASVKEVLERFPDPGLPLVVSSFRLVSDRAVDECISAVAWLGRTGFPVNYLIVGDGPDLPRLQAVAVESGAAVSFFGPCYDEATLAKIYAAAEVSVAPRMVGLSALQSLAYGTMMVTCDDITLQTPEWEVLEDGVSAVLYTAGDVSALARAMRKVIALSRSGEIDENRLRKRLAESYNPAEHARRINTAVLASARGWAEAGGS